MNVICIAHIAYTKKVPMGFEKKEIEIGKQFFCVS